MGTCPLNDITLDIISVPNCNIVLYKVYSALCKSSEYDKCTWLTVNNSELSIVS
jgi:hypothetical protein